ncbi:hypothetical protein Pcinc_010734 [Petrolisthes cinctipes]|uniref:Uncharacterized protein n=1 Tax=Petrolisthes cinctipes TaxID=88211 RepID=A0AAE1G4E1_PETCI|nr:hypothetical protein Pcinc_010734 [Petrolisthes cinctipes]
MAAAGRQRKKLSQAIRHEPGQPKEEELYVNFQFLLFINMTIEQAVLELNGTYTMEGSALEIPVTGDGNFR